MEESWKVNLKVQFVQTFSNPLPKLKMQSPYHLTVAEAVSSPLASSDGSGAGILASDWLLGFSTLTSLVSTGLAPGGGVSSVTGPGSLTDCLRQESCHADLNISVADLYSASSYEGGGVSDTGLGTAAESISVVRPSADKTKDEQHFSNCLMSPESGMLVM